MCRRGGLRVYIEMLQFVCGFVNLIDYNFTKKKATEHLLSESCQPSLINVSLSYRILRKSRRLTSRQTSHLDTDYRT